jgi:hypothetical protein
MDSHNLAQDLFNLSDEISDAGVAERIGDAPLVEPQDAMEKAARGTIISGASRKRRAFVDQAVAALRPNDTVRTEFQKSRAEFDALNAKLRKLQAEVAELELVRQQLSAIESSTSWRMTYPLRRLMHKAWSVHSAASELIKLAWQTGNGLPHFVRTRPKGDRTFGGEPTSSISSLEVEKQEEKPGLQQIPGQPSKLRRPLVDPQKKPRESNARPVAEREIQLKARTREAEVSDTLIERWKARGHRRSQRTSLSLTTLAESNFGTTVVSKTDLTNGLPLDLAVPQRDNGLEYRLSSYSQEGEDLLLWRLFEGKNEGFYVDVGAHHPVRFSNTYLFYQNGWRGINVDATPGSMAEFRRLRPHDINLEALVSAERDARPFFLLNEPALNSVSASLSAERTKKNSQYTIIGEVRLTPKPLSEILAENLPEGQSIDFYSIDAEGLDLSVLRSNDWMRHRPSFILAELLETTFDDLAEHEITRYLCDQGYTPNAKLVNTVLFTRD